MILGFRPGDWNLGLKNRILGGGVEKKRKKEKIPHMGESIGHRPLGAAAQKGIDQPTNRPTDRRTDIAGC